MRQQLSKLVFLIVLLCVALLGKYLLMGRASYVSLQSSSVANAISSSLKNPSNSSYIPIEGHSYNVQSVQYFDDKQWAVASVLPVGSSADPGTLVLSLDNGSYKTVLGPGNQFYTSDLNGIPSDVTNYLRSQGLIINE